MSVHIEIRQAVEDALGEIDYDWCEQYREAIVESICIHIEVTAAEIDQEVLEEGETAEERALHLFLDDHDWQAEVERATTEVQEFALSVEWEPIAGRDAMEIVLDGADWDLDDDGHFALSRVDPDLCRDVDNALAEVKRKAPDMEDREALAIARSLADTYAWASWLAGYARDAAQHHKRGDFDNMMDNLEDCHGCEMERGDNPWTRDLLNRLFPAR